MSMIATPTMVVMLPHAGKQVAHVYSSVEGVHHTHIVETLQRGTRVHVLKTRCMQSGEERAHVKLVDATAPLGWLSTARERLQSGQPRVCRASFPLEGTLKDNFRIT